MAEIEGYNMPDELYYHEEGAWVKVEGDTVRVGLNDHFQQSAGDIVYVDLPFEGDDIEEGDGFGKVQSSKWIGKLIAPLGGTIEEVNYELDSDSTIINKDPYGEGWVAVITPSDLDAALEGMAHGVEAVTEFIKRQNEKAEQIKAVGGGAEE
ncbi:glycine cleavage system protein H [Candidatus Poribacteria bacterium]